MVSVLGLGLEPSLLSFSSILRLLTDVRVLESLKAGRRLPEASFGNLRVASKGQPSVYGAFSKQAAS